MKLKIKWMLLTTFLTGSLTALSQSNEDSLQTDDSQVTYDRETVKTLYKYKIIAEDRLKQLETKDTIIDTKNAIIVEKDSIIFNLNDKISNNIVLIELRDQEIKGANELSDRLERDLKKERLKTKLTGGLGIAAILGSILILK